MKCLVDTDWIIDHLKGIEKVREKLKERRIKNFFNQRIKLSNKISGYEGSLLLWRTYLLECVHNVGKKLLKQKLEDGLQN